MKFKTKLNLFIFPSIFIPVVFVIITTFAITSNKIQNMEYELLNNNIRYILDKCNTENAIIKALGMENVAYYRDATKQQVLNDIRNTSLSNRTIYIQDIQTKVVVFSTQVNQNIFIKNPDILNRMAKSKKGYQEFNLKTDARNYIEIMAAFAVYDKWGWLIVCCTEKNIVYKYMREALTLSICVIFLVFVICIICIWHISKRINRSFKILSDGASRLSANCFDAQIKIQGNDEFVDLAKNFNIMATEIKKSQDDLKESEKLLRAMAENYPNSYISIIEKDFTVGFTSGREFKKKNVDPIQFFGLKIEDVFGKQASEIKEHYRKTFNGQETTFELVFKGEYQLYRAVPLISKDGSINRILVVVENITERKQFELHLQQSQKMEAISTLAGGIAHDFNNLLGVITGNVSYSLSQLHKNDELFEVLSDIQEGTIQAEKLTKQLLTFAKGGEPIKTVADMNQLIKEASQFVTRGLKSRCEYELSENLSLVEIDTGQINQVINNLVINANQAMPQGGTIYIKTVNEIIASDNKFTLAGGRYVKISIEDQGVGISDKHLSKIFDPFFTTRQKGNGLGLSTVYSIIKKHKGHIVVYSELNKGTVFHVFIPASQKELEKTEENIEVKVTHQGSGRILIMDDQEAILTMLCRMLNRMGYETDTSLEGNEAIEKYRDAYQSQNPFDLVILDLTVPGGKGGKETIFELLKIDPKVKALVSSGYSNDPIMSNYEDYNFCGVLPKPYTKPELSEVLSKVFFQD